jgi:amino acid permease
MMARLKYWRFAIFMGCLFSLNCLCTAAVAAFAGKQWPTMSGTDKFITIAAVLGNWAGHLMAFCSKTVARLDEGRMPVVVLEEEPTSHEVATTKGTK